MSRVTIENCFGCFPPAGTAVRRNLLIIYCLLSAEISLNPNHCPPERRVNSFRPLIIAILIALSRSSNLSVRPILLLERQEEGEGEGGGKLFPPTTRSVPIGILGESHRFPDRSLEPRN